MVDTKGPAMSEATEHLISSYEQEFVRLRELTGHMGGLVEKQLTLAATALLSLDSEAATRAVELDPAVDALEREVEQFAIRMIALRQPVGDDLRRLVAAMRASVDLERIGDYAANVARRSLILGQFRMAHGLTALGHMTRLVQDSLKLIIDAMGESDAEKAIQVWRSDRAIDDLYNTIVRELVTYMMEDPRNITPCMHLLFVAKNLERIGDHATNIAETIHYAVTGEVMSEARPKGNVEAYLVERDAG